MGAPVADAGVLSPDTMYIAWWVRTNATKASAA